MSKFAEIDNWIRANRHGFAGATLRNKFFVDFTWL